MQLIESFIYFIFYTFLSGHPNYQIMGKSMIPAYNQGAYVLSDKYTANTRIQHGEVIVFKNPQKPSTVIINRVIALPKDKLIIKGGSVYLNGDRLEEDYVNGTQTNPAKFIKESEEITIPEDNYFVMGDNRPFSLDSRVFGPIPSTSIVGKVTKCYWNCHK